MRSTQSILDEIGNTSMIPLNRIAAGVSSEIYAKLEMMNPMGSVKDRIARHMVEKAEREGRIKPGDTIVDNSSGNTALGLGDEFLIKCVEFELIDDMVRVEDRTAFAMTRKLANTEAIFAGGSSGAAVWACLELARRIGRKARIVTILSDSANRYLSTIYNDDWLRQKFGDGWEPPAA